MSHVFMMLQTSLYIAATVFPPNSSLRSAQNTYVSISASGLQGYQVLAVVSGCVLWHSQSALCFVGFLAELKVNLDQKPVYSICSRSDCHHVSFTTTGFVFCNSSVLLFLHGQDTMSY